MIFYFYMFIVPCLLILFQVGFNSKFNFFRIQISISWIFNYLYTTLSHFINFLHCNLTKLLFLLFFLILLYFILINFYSVYRNLQKKKYLKLELIANFQNFNYLKLNFIFQFKFISFDFESIITLLNNILTIFKEIPSMFLFLSISCFNLKTIILNYYIIRTIYIFSFY